MARIAIVTADNLGHENTGMVTVDLAAAAAIRRAVPEAELTWYALHPPELDPRPSRFNPIELPFKHRPLVPNLDEMLQHDAIIYWGDFLQALHYFVEDATWRLQVFDKMSKDAAMRILLRTLLLRDAPTSVLDKVVVFGSTILFNKQSDYCSDYGLAFTRFIKSCRSIWVREPISAAKIAHFRSDYDVSYLGTDAAFLLRQEDTQALSTTGWSNTLENKKKIGLFFGARTRQPFSFDNLCSILCQQLQAELEWIPWLPVHQFVEKIPARLWLTPKRAVHVREIRKTVKRYFKSKRDYTGGDLLAALPKYKLIITDTYHLCVNAWRVGTPAVCIGAGDRSLRQQTLNDFKKRALYGMYDATDFHYNLIDISSRNQARNVAHRIAAILQSGEVPHAIVRRIRNHARHVENRLTGTLSGLVQSPLNVPTQDRIERRAGVSPADGRDLPGDFRTS